MPRGCPKTSDGDTQAAKTTKPEKANGNGANLGFKVQRFLPADKLRKNFEPSDYKHVALGLIFLSSELLFRPFALRKDRVKDAE